jgi:hypothetical protein
VHDPEPKLRKGRCAKLELIQPRPWRKKRRSILAFPPPNATPVCGAAEASETLRSGPARLWRRASGPCVAGLWPMTGHQAGSIETLRRVRPSGPPAALSCNHHVSVR